MTTLTGRDASIRPSECGVPPGGMTQSPEQVVEEAIYALRARRVPTLVTGWRNRAMIFMTRLLSRRKVVSLLGRRGKGIRP